ncbi:hypothetical protein AN958_03412 [Leucoagaricus sp. SymC.cos]|nr:hypothetical protein AN958_03412 [Leucoagaricus sp. SymC.cos]
MVGSDCSLPVFQRCCRVQVRSRKERCSGPKPPWLIVGNVYNGKSMIFDVASKLLSLVNSTHYHLGLAAYCKDVEECIYVRLTVDFLQRTQMGKG